jgi:hypothetical protein
MNHGSLFRSYVQIKGEAAGHRAKMVLLVVRRGRFSVPTIDPHMEATRFGARFPNAGSTDLFRVTKPVSVLFGQGGMRQVEVSDGPS